MDVINTSIALPNENTSYLYFTPLSGGPTIEVPFSVAATPLPADGEPRPLPPLPAPRTVDDLDAIFEENTRLTQSSRTQLPAGSSEKIESPFSQATKRIENSFSRVLEDRQTPPDGLDLIWHMTQFTDVTAQINRRFTTSA